MNPRKRRARPLLGRRFERALSYATRLHAAQVRKGTCTPYLAHLLGVASLALENGADEDEAIAALLHDAVEDQGGTRTLDEICRRFGGRVVSIVEGCSDSIGTPKPPWRARKEMYVNRLRKAPQSVRLVSLADKLHNARALLADYRQHGDAVFLRFSADKDDVLWYYTALADVFRFVDPGHPAEELGRVVKELVQLADGRGTGRSAAGGQDAVADLSGGILQVGRALPRPPSPTSEAPTRSTTRKRIPPARRPT